jgi:hypothetical protein
MIIRSKPLALMVAAGVLVLIAVLLLSGDRRSAADARPATRASVPALKPLRVIHRGHDLVAHYDKSSTNPSPRHAPVKLARAAQVLEGFSVLARPQTAAEREDFDIQQFAKDVPTAKLDGARALNTAGTVWIIPTSDGQLCIGMKTGGDGTTFVHGCGPAANALTTGLSMTHGDGKLALLPDSARAGQALAKGARTAVDQDVSRNYVWLPEGGTVTFTDTTGAHTL